MSAKMARASFGKSEPKSEPNQTNIGHIARQPCDPKSTPPLLAETSAAKLFLVDHWHTD
jgi:hypothetical protein